MYQLMAGGVKHIPDGANIPDEPANRDWQEYQEWLAKGNTPKPEFTAAELKAKTAADKEAKARAVFAKRDFEERFLASPEKAALK